MLGLYASSYLNDGSSSALQFDDYSNSCGYSSGNFYLCSTNDQYCLAGTYNSTGYGSCSLCAEGSYSNVIGSASCSSCPLGSYCPLGSSEPTPCEAGTYNDATGGTNSSTCVACDLGYLCSAGAFSCSLDEQLAALVAFRNSVTCGDSGCQCSEPLSSWTGSSFCSGSWTGVTCTNGSVSSIELHRKCLQGTLPIEWSALTSMSILSLNDNSFKGPLPASWASLTNLDPSGLNLNGNQIYGTIPSGE